MYLKPQIRWLSYPLTGWTCWSSVQSENSSRCMCVVVEAVRLCPALLNDQLRCVLSQPGEFWQRRLRAAEHWCQKAAYLDGWVHYHLLITGGFSGVFITCVDRGCVYVCVRESGGYCYTGWTAGGQPVCVGGVQGFLFQLCCRLCAIFMSSVGISVLRSAQAASPSQTAFCTPSNTISAHWQLWLLYMHHVYAVWNSNSVI